MLLSNRQADALEYVRESLAEKGCAITHRDDLFGSDAAEIWDRAEKFMEDFATSEAALRLEEAHHKLIHENLELNAREKEFLDKQKALVEETGADLEKWRKRVEELKANPNPLQRRGLVEANNKFRAAAQANREARATYNVKQKEFAIERKTLNRVFKPYVFHGTNYLGRAVNYADAPIALTGHDRFLDIADNYYGEAAKIRIATIWRVAPIPEGVPEPPRKGSQLWHRDQTDGKILKVFIYFSDVDEGTGAMEYVPDSWPENSRWAEEIPLSAQSGYPPQELVFEKVPQKEIVRCEGRRGTIVFADTAGLHRGGYAITGPRVTVQSTYLRQHPKYPQSPLIWPGFVDPALPARQAFAFS
jgi:hypothetical protein